MNRPRRILMTADAMGGVWTYSMELCRSLDHYDIQILLATMGDRPTAAQRAEVRELIHVELAESDFKLEWMSEPWRDVEAAGRWLLELEEQFQPDVIHLNGFAHGDLSFQAPVLIVAHSCVLSWWQAVNGTRAPASWNEYQCRVHRGLTGSDAVVVPTRAMITTLERHYGPLANVEVIYNGRALSRFKPGPKEPFIISAGRVWDDAKNMRVLSRVANRLSWPVHVAGSQSNPEEQQEQPSELTNVTLLGHLPESELAALFSRASIGVFPALYEPFGLAILEAALSGCAMVLGDVPTLRELWEGAAVLVPPLDEAALQGAIGSLIEHRERREELASLARRRALGLSAERMGQSYVATYARMMFSRMETGIQGHRKRGGWSDRARAAHQGARPRPATPPGDTVKSNRRWERHPLG